jgi:hypothetical protein
MYYEYFADTNPLQTIEYKVYAQNPPGRRGLVKDNGKES